MVVHDLYNFHLSQLCDFGFARAMSTNTVVLRSIKGLSNLYIKFLVTFLFCELLLRCYDTLDELRCSNTTSIYIIQALHCIWLRNWYGNSLTTTRLIYGPLELFCMLNLIDCTLELFIAKLVGLDAMLVVLLNLFHLNCNLV